MMEVLVIENGKEFKLELFSSFPKIRNTGQAVILSWGVGERQVEVTMTRTLIKTLGIDCDNCDSLKNELEDGKQENLRMKEELRDSVWDRLTLFA